jgi:hypothetical protein
MLSQVREKDLVLFDDLAAGRVTDGSADSAEEVELRVLIPAFMISELRPRVRDRIFDRVAVSRDRHDRGHHNHVDGYDDAPTDCDLACRSRPCSLF